MKQFYLTQDIELTIECTVLADSLEEAIQKTKEGDYELPSLNDGDIYDTRLIRLTDENWNIVKEFCEK